MAHLPKLIISWVISQSMFSDYNDTKLEINKQYILKEFLIKNKITLEIRKYFEENHNDDKTYQDLSGASKPVLRGNVRAALPNYNYQKK